MRNTIINIEMINFDSWFLEPEYIRSTVISIGILVGILGPGETREKEGVQVPKVSY